MIIGGKSVTLKEGRLIFQSTEDAEQLRRLITTDESIRTAFVQIEGFVSSDAAFEQANQLLSEADVLPDLNQYATIGVLLDDDGEQEWSKVVDDPGVQYMANENAIFQIADDIYKIYRDFALVVPQGEFFAESEATLLANSKLKRIPIIRSSVAKSNISDCAKEWGPNLQRRRVKGELEHRSGLFNSNKEGIIRTKGQRRRTGIWWQYNMTTISHIGGVQAVLNDDVVYGYSISQIKSNDDEIDTTVFTCENCVGFCGDDLVEHSAERDGGPGKCNTQAPDSCY